MKDNNSNRNEELFESTVHGTSEKRYDTMTYLKMIIFSIFGVFAFFISFPIAEHTFNIFGYTFIYTGGDTFLVNHFASFVKTMLMPIMRYIVYIIGIVGIVDLYVRRHKHFKTKVQTAFSIFKLVGIVILTFIVFDFGPSIIRAENAALGKSIGKFILDSILIPITISIPAAAIFLPFLLDYGLVDFVGVILRPVMRPVFKLPGRAAVIAVSAFLGNFSIGHIAVNDAYKSGRFTEKESVIIGTSLSTVSVGFLMVLANNTGIMEYWNLYFWTAFLITLIVAFVGIRLYPLNKIQETYYPGVEPKPEPEYKDSLFKNAWFEALEVAYKSENPFRRMGGLMKETIIILGTVATGTAFFASTGVILYQFTPIFRWIGYIFYPIMKIVGIPSTELVTTSTGAALSFLEVTIPALLVTTGEWSMQTRYMLAVIPVSSIIFLASFVPCLMATEVPIKFGHMVVIWFERMVLSIILAGIFGLILF